MVSIVALGMVRPAILVSPAACATASIPRYDTMARVIPWTNSGQDGLVPRLNLAGFACGPGGPCVSHSGATGLSRTPRTQLHHYCNALAEEVLVFSELVPIVERPVA